jgi:hypothetical protein
MYIYICLNIYMFIYMHICIYIDIDIVIYIYVYIHIYIYIYIYKYSDSDSDPVTTCNLLEPKSNEPFVDMTSELTDFFQNAPIALHWLSKTGLIIWANNYEILSLGYSSEEYIGIYVYIYIYISI